jgi:hypothetical protein
MNDDLNGENDDTLELRINKVQPSERLNKPKLPLCFGDSASGILVDSDASRSYYLHSINKKMEEDLESAKI